MKYQILADNYPVLKTLGLYHWIFDGGFDGSSCTILTAENPPITPNMCGLVSNPFPDIAQPPPMSGEEYTFHAYQTAHAALQFSGNVKIETAPDAYSIDGSGIISGFLHDTLIPRILKNKPIGEFRSKNDMSHGMDSEYGKISDFCFLVCSDGNTDQNNAEYSRLIDDKSWYGIGAALYNPTQGFFPAYYTDVTPNGDFCYPGDIAVPALNGVSLYVNGTSFSAPAFIGMCAVVQDFAFKKLGRFFTCSELYALLKSWCLDIGDPGKDSLTGWGIPILPPYESIDLSKYTAAPAVPVAPTEPAPNADHDPWANDATAWAIANRLFKGDENGDYHWRDAITREQLAQVLYNMNHK